MSNDYDAIVLGAGSPGQNCAGALAEGGLRVAVVERELVGGEVALVEGAEHVLAREPASLGEALGDRLLVATGRRPRTAGIGPETVGIDPDTRGIPVDERLRAGEGLWAIGDVTGIWPLTRTGCVGAPTTLDAEVRRPRMDRVSVAG